MTSFTASTRFTAFSPTHDYPALIRLSTLLGLCTNVPRNLSGSVRAHTLPLALPVPAPIMMYLRTSHPRSGVSKPAVHVLRRRARERVARGRGCRERRPVDDRARVGRGCLGHGLADCARDLRGVPLGVCCCLLVFSSAMSRGWRDSEGCVLTSWDDLPDVPSYWRHVCGGGLIPACRRR